MLRSVVTEHDEKSFARERRRLKNDITHKAIAVVTCYDAEFCDGLRVTKSKFVGGLAIFDAGTDCLFGCFTLNCDRVGLFVLDAACDYVRAHGYKRIIGPMNGDIWHGYRYRTNGFDVKTFMSPNNSESYPRIWERAGFRTLKTWNDYRISFPLAERQYAKFKKRYDMFIERGYRFETLRGRGFKRRLRDVHALVMDTFSGFAMFTPLTFYDFYDLFGALAFLADDASWVAYDGNGHAAGFVVTMPNYAICETLSSKLRLRKHPTEYVVLWLGVKPESAGLGSAFAHLMSEQQKKTNSGCIASLVSEDAASMSYVASKSEPIAEYKLFVKTLH